MYTFFRGSMREHGGTYVSDWTVERLKFEEVIIKRRRDNARM